MSAGSIPDHCAIGVSTKPGQSAIARTPAGVELLVQGARERDHGSLRGAVGCEARRRHRAGDRGEVDDPASRLAQGRDRRLRHEEEPAQVDVELEVEALQRQVLDRAADPDAGGVDEHVEVPEPVAVLGNDPRAVLRLRHVRRDRCGAELGCRRLHFLWSA
jgi:hypothetical protein